MPNIQAHPSPADILEWHFVLEGSRGSEYEGGVYHGRITFPPQYPFKPPSISLFTPNGRFAVNTKLCLSMTDFHPESWRARAPAPARAMREEGWGGGVFEPPLRRPLAVH